MITKYFPKLLTSSQTTRNISTQDLGKIRKISIVLVAMEFVITFIIKTWDFHINILICF